MRNLAIRLLINAVALWLAAYLVDGIWLSPDFFDVLVVATLFGLVNALVKPVVTVLALPLIFLTLGLLVFVINAAMLMLTDALAGSLQVSGFRAALWGSLIISVVNMVLTRALGEEKD